MACRYLKIYCSLYTLFLLIVMWLGKFLDRLPAAYFAGLYGASTLNHILIILPLSVLFVYYHFRYRRPFLESWCHNG